MSTWDDNATRADLAARFRALHERPGAFIVPNPWDIGTARILASLGFEALATTSLGVANVLGRPVMRDDVLRNAAAIAGATELPVTVDLENGFAHDPAAVATCIRAAADTGVVGASIEDFSSDRNAPIYDFELAVERVHAAAEAAHALPVPLLLTARAENFLHGRHDLDDTLRRLQAFERVGADVLYAPGAFDLATIRLITSSVGKPVNVVTGFLDPSIDAAALADAGVKRISVGGALSRLALASFLRAAYEMRDHGRFTWLQETAPISTLQQLFAKQDR